MRKPSRVTLTVIAACAFAWLGQSRALASVEPSSGSPLDFVVVEVNGQSKLIHSESALSIVKGDKVVLRSVTLQGDDKGPVTLNLVGFVGGKPGDPSEDRGRVVDTGKDLIRRWSIDGKGERYKVRASSGSRVHGYIYIDLAEPELRYAVLKINGKARIMREGEPLRVTKTDKFKVERIVTNLADLDAGVTFRVVADDSSRVEKSPTRPYEIQFLRSGRVFAKIPLVIEGK